MSHFRRSALLACALLGLLAGCARRREPAAPPRPLALEVSVLADTGATAHLPAIPPPEARVWLARVSPARPTGAPPSPPAPAPDSADVVESPDAPPVAQVDEGLKPPILRAAAPLVVPAGSGAASVELEVEVDESGAVAAASWAGGARDSALVAAAMRCARAMRFFPAERAGRPVAVWCRQRFDFGAAR